MNKQLKVAFIIDRISHQMKVKGLKGLVVYEYDGGRVVQYGELASSTAEARNIEDGDWFVGFCDSSYEPISKSTLIATQIVIRTRKTYPNGETTISFFADGKPVVLDDMNGFARWNSKNSEDMQMINKKIQE